MSLLFRDCAFIRYLNMALYELVYSSYSLLNQVEIQEMVSKSIITNKQNGITGCLLISESEFFQVIEGEKATVLALFDKIQADKRHSRIKLMWSSNIDERAFGKWTMMCKEISKSTLQLTGEATTGKELLEIITAQVL